MDQEAFLEQVRTGSDTERLMYYLQVMRTRDTTDYITLLYREIGILETQMSVYGKLFWRGLIASVVAISIAFFLDLFMLIMIWAVGSAIGIAAYSVLILQIKDRTEVLQARLEHSERHAHFFWPPNENEDLKVNSKLWTDVRSWWRAHS